jgi:hypothetical protein
LCGKLPVDYGLARKIADSAIELFIECRDVHGMDEARARLDAVTTVAEGASTPDDPAAAPQPGEPGFNSHTWRQQKRDWDR